MENIYLILSLLIPAYPYLHILAHLPMANYCQTSNISDT